MKIQNKIIISHPNGNANTRSAVYGLCHKGMLYKYVTSVAVFSSGFWHYISNIPGLNAFKRKSYKDIIKEKVLCYPIKELGRQFCGKFKLMKFLKHETGLFCVDKECEYIDKKTAKLLQKDYRKVCAVYGYEDIALHTFKMAKELGKICIYDLPIGYWRAMHELLERERNEQPEWAVTLGGLNNSAAKLARKDEELQLADKIYVASSFTKWSLKDFPMKLADVEVIPYGFPPINEQRQYESFDNGRKIKALFVGGLSQRKGLSYVFEAIKGLEEQVELTVVGRGNIEGCLALREALRNVHYIQTLAHKDVLKLMSESDILLFPSLFEGFGLVITEAMSQGTPVITTDRTCGPDIITNGKDGWIVEAGTAAPIHNLLETFINEPDLLAVVGRNALKTAALRPWEKYEQELSESIYTFLNDKL